MTVRFRLVQDLEERFFLKKVMAQGSVRDGKLVLQSQNVPQSGSVVSIFCRSAGLLHSVQCLPTATAKKVKSCEFIHTLLLSDTTWL